MKYILRILIGLFAGGIYMACSPEEIEFYDQDACINFYSDGLECIFVDSNYIQKTEALEAEFSVILQGRHLQKARNFRLKTTTHADYKNAPKVELSNYKFTALDTVTQRFSLKVMSPTLRVNENQAEGCYLEFDIENPEHEFKKGMIERNRIPITARWNLRPKGWTAWKWGEYSDAKYKFMMDVCGYVYSKMKSEDQARVKQAYTDYLSQGNEPIVDDKGNEIQFI